jgi:uncharacterized protein YqiB (DUF1249 family)
MQKIQHQNYQKLLGVIPDLREIKEHARLKAAGLMDLNVDVLERGEQVMQVALSHYI